jgi:hypothetical protein
MFSGRFRGISDASASIFALTITVSALIASYPTARFATGLDPNVLRLAFAVFFAGA